MIKAISFDVWNTLVSPNPVFAEARTKLIAAELELPESVVKKSYTKVKRQVDSLAETNGVSYTTQLVYSTLLRELVGHKKGVRRQVLINDVNALFLKYPPTTPESTLQAVKDAVEHGLKIGIASNSNFISGKIMHPFLEERFGVKFDFSVYSDLSLYAKPAKNFFREVLEKSEVLSDEIIHIGDSLVCDSGSIKVGIHYRIIKNADKLHDVIRGIYDAEKE